jgi:hypothetical protein
MVLVSHMPYNSYQLYFAHSEVYLSHGCTTKIFKLALKILVSMNSMSLGMFPSLTHPIINSKHSTDILFIIQIYTSPIILLSRPDQLRLLPLARTKSTARRTNTGCTMTTSQNIRKGVRSGRNAGPEPQILTFVK